MRTPKFWYKDNSTLKYILYPLTFLWILGSYFRKKYTIPKKNLTLRTPNPYQVELCL